MKKKSKGWGGKRAGAGRPRSEQQMRQSTVRLTRAEIARIDAQRPHGETRYACFGRLLREAIDRGLEPVSVLDTGERAVLTVGFRLPADTWEHLEAMRTFGRSRSFVVRALLHARTGGST